MLGFTELQMRWILSAAFAAVLLLVLCPSKRTPTFVACQVMLAFVPVCWIRFGGSGYLRDVIRGCAEWVAAHV